MLTNELNPVKGPFGSIYSLDKAIEIGGSVLNPIVPKAGRVGSQHSGVSPTSYGGAATAADRGRFQLGVPAFNIGYAPIPIFLLQNSDDFDVIGDYGNIIGAPASVDATTGGTYNGRTGIVSGLVATGGFELETTEFRVAGGITNATYAPGALLVSYNVNDADLGRVVFAGATATLVTNLVTLVGVVSDGVVGAAFTSGLTGNAGLNQDQPGAPNRLRFYPCYIPRF
jgi:hypothetical protein